MTWTQVYDPLGCMIGSACLAALPIVVLLGLLATGRVPTPLAAGCGLATALALALLVYIPDMGDPSVTFPERVASWAPTVFAAALYGALFGLCPIGWIVLSAIFLYNLTVETEQFEIVKRSVVGLSPDRRIQALLIAFSFGAFIEGAAGFGAPVAITAALMVGTGFPPVLAAGLALLANTSPVAFGALGTPILTLARVTDQDPLILSAMAGRQLPFFSLLIPAWLVWVLAGWRGLLEVWPAIVTAGGSFALVQFLLANYHGPLLVDVLGGLVSLLAVVILLRFWQPARIWRFAHDEGATAVHKPTRRETVRAWTPWLVLSLCVFAWGWAPVKERLQSLATFRWPLPWLHERIARDRPVVPQREIEKAVYELPLAATTGTGIFVAALLTALFLRLTWKQTTAIFLRTLFRMRWPLVTIGCMLAIAFTTRYSSMDATLGLACAHTGVLFPVFSPLLGWLGVALTGSDTSSNALFGGLQKITALGLVQRGVVPLDPGQAVVLFTTANSTGGVMGKMIDAQSIVVSAVATGQAGQEGSILRFVFWHSLVLALLMGLLVTAQAYWLTRMIPHP